MPKYPKKRSKRLRKLTKYTKASLFQGSLTMLLRQMLFKRLALFQKGTSSYTIMNLKSETAT